MTTASPVPQKSRWPGLVLSLLVPGFGLFRTGRIRRGVAWLLGLPFFGLLSGLCFGLSAVPFWLAVLVLLVSIVLQILMLCDSFKPGGMTLPLWLLFFFLLTAFILLPSPASLVARAFKIPTGGMEPTLLGPKSASTPDLVIVDRLSYSFGPPQRGDVIVFVASQITGLRLLGMTGEEEFYFKRLVGLPGERIRIADGKVFANGRLLSESDGVPPISYTEPVETQSSAKREGQEFIVGPNEYFVLGDNSPNSLDSRYWGGVPASAIYGKVTMIYYPFNRAGRITTP